MRGETEKLVADLDALKRVTASIANERASLLATLQAQAEERHRLDALVLQKQKLRALSEENRAAETKKIAELAGKAKSLKDLIATLEKDLAASKTLWSASGTTRKSGWRWSKRRPKTPAPRPPCWRPASASIR